MFELCKGSLKVPLLYTKWYEAYKDANLGAFVSFCGIVRAEDELEGLSFDICENLLRSWFITWQEKVEKEGVKLCFAHSIGDVKVHESSYLAGVFSKQRKLGLTLINEFVEDFKANAPIWKYDLLKGQRIYAKDRSIKLLGAGLLSDKG
ncbi:molybdenum cofactor biosynthesis protein MoaE [Campylobacter sp. MIT 97-5078]|uniref:molybdenum cofactor biosynthesis protein MoaE n=1 Tax=Campylobacter sp. MIT 97-5078 TaxID=1548153 RepID=UPI000513DD3E|nr:molybdenum cofactor biosynthesis protein MoaE [Campylobacter sp. MIT 97-5078]KGI56072.1 molybdenum cofactor biosynthesis protein MoaE [Campylobacter sp. MIT 97-5078]TQR27726.1 molybdenum cofactor biosynthesis protein MoaE [Campylobacter sp. MIT 97-5078]